MSKNIDKRIANFIENNKIESDFLEKLPKIKNQFEIKSIEFKKYRNKLIRLVLILIVPSIIFAFYKSYNLTVENLYIIIILIIILVMLYNFKNMQAGQKFFESIFDDLNKLTSQNMRFLMCRGELASDYSKNPFTPMHNAIKESMFLDSHVEEVHFCVSRIYATYTTSSRSNRTTTVTFNGILFKIDFNKDFDGKIFITNRKRLNKNKMNGYDRVRLEDPIFEKKFDVYANCPIETRYIFSLDFIYNFFEAINSNKIKNSFAWFQDGYTYIAIEEHFDLTPQIKISDFNTVIDVLEYIMKYFEDTEKLIKKLKIDDNFYNIKFEIK